MLDESAVLGDITRCLQDWRGGDEEALSRLTGAVYRDLRRLASFLFAAESGDRTLQPTALVHELYLQLPGVQHLDWQSRAQFLSVAARIMPTSWWITRARGTPPSGAEALRR